MVYTGTYFVIGKLYLYLCLSFQDAGGSKVDEFLVSIAIILGVFFVLYCLYIISLPNLRRFLEIQSQRSGEEDPNPSKIRKVLNKLVIMILRDSSHHPNQPIRSIETKMTNPVQLEHRFFLENDQETQKKSLPTSSSALTENDLGSQGLLRRGSINHTEGSADDLNLLRNRMWCHASGSVNHIEGSANNLNPRETNNDLITITSDRGTYKDLLPLDVETLTTAEKKQRNKRRSITSIPTQILGVKEQMNRVQKSKGSKNTQATMNTMIFKKSEFEDNRFKKIDEIEVYDNVPHDTIFETNSDGNDDEMSGKNKVLTLDDIFKEYKQKP